jgi:ribosomal protein L11 methyltransferase
MWRVEIPCDRGAEELTLARFLPYDLAAADSDTPGLARAWFALHDEATRCAKDLGGSIHKEAEDNWNASWQESQWHATPLGERLWLAPPWDLEPAPDGRIRIEMHAGTLFGNGDHPTTQLCLEALERRVRPGATVADIGCGSGLLSQAALLLGARSAIGCDLDPRAAKHAAGYQGSVDSLQSASVDILVANIQIGTLNELLPEIWRVLKPGGVAILSGLLEEQLPLLGAPAENVTSKDGWVCVESSVRSRGPSAMMEA